MLKTALYLIPVPLGDTPVEQVLPSYNREVIAGIRHFIVENVRSARRFLKKSNPDICIDDLVPLVGPSSILMSLMASGFNGQSFAFQGYLPIEAGERIKRIKQLEQRVYAEGQTQIFIETPYRNHKMIEDLVRSCRPHTRLCVAAGISCPDESIRTLSLGEWAKTKYDYQKTPAIFLLYK